MPPPPTTSQPTDPDAPAVADGGLLLRLRDPRLRLALLAVVAVTATVVVVQSGGLSRAGLQEFVDDAGPLGPVLYVVLYAVLTVAFVPGTPLTLAGGALFGAVLGTALTVLGATIGATGAFLIGRRLGREGVEQLGSETVQRLDRFVTERGFVAILVARLAPIFPFNLLNYASGVTGVRLREYVLATFLGIIPATYAFSALGGNFDDPTSPEFLTAVGMVVVLLVGGGIYARRTSQTEAGEGAG